MAGRRAGAGARRALDDAANRPEILPTYRVVTDAGGGQWVAARPRVVHPAGRRAHTRMAPAVRAGAILSEPSTARTPSGGGDLPVPDRRCAPLGLLLQAVAERQGEDDEGGRQEEVRPPLDEVPDLRIPRTRAAHPTGRGSEAPDRAPAVQGDQQRRQGEPVERAFLEQEADECECDHD